ncbi:hypothetical protein [Nitrococcus mobilis]|uniref:Uncharacterized protein n=1 Tax=Nitrococcus mobilis Nb-231 TaxID=314278 RepID=A4BNP1_9GAMM|nr:hypothetical protein [Nitrococcus mobilis]EAR22840.1 hypothetical protein NB231_10318 [Nitrococcus mobilis Nb-231]
MSYLQKTHIFSLLHIDIARNSTDDFNLFHDKKKWHQIHHNPFGGPIVLGFQLEAFIEGAVREHRITYQDDILIAQKNLQYSNYQFSFANPVKPEQVIDIKINRSLFSNDLLNPILSNRVSLKSGGKLSMAGYKKESQKPLFLPNPDLPDFKRLINASDREFLGDTGFFIKRKFMNTSNAKNFLAGSLIEQSDYFDEIEGKANFPEMFPCALISCALLENVIKEKLDFKRNPMVYTSHKISIDRHHLSHLKSNDSLHLLVRLIQEDKNSASSLQQTYECYGVINHESLLFRSLVSLVPLTGK